jgi:SAM-dependent methyltransferase
MVVEHLNDPVRQFSEVARVLQPGGVFLFHTPNLHSYVTLIARLLPYRVKKIIARVIDGRVEEDVYPTYYRANTTKMIRDITARAGLEVMAMHFTMSAPIFTIIPPLAAIELLYLRQLMRRPKLTPYRQTLICVLQRPAE